MKNNKITKIIIASMLLLSLTACNKENEDRIVTNEDGGSITVIDNGEKETRSPLISVEKIEHLENMEVCDWLDNDTVIVSKDNENMAKMTMTDLQDLYPKSLYSYNINTKEYNSILEKENVILQGGTLSEDRNFLLYSEYVLGDPAYYVMNLTTKESFCLMSEEIDFARSAIWFGNEIAGSSYKNGGYLANTSGDISVLDGFKDESVFILRMTKDNIYYNTGEDTTLVKVNRSTGEKTKLNLNNVFDVIISHDGSKMLVLQSDSTKSSLILCDLDGNNQVTVVEGSDLGGVSWSADNRMIAYNVNSMETDASVSGLYVYDILNAQSTQIAVDVQNAFTVWSPNGDKLIYGEWKGDVYDSSIVYLKSSI